MHEDEIIGCEWLLDLPEGAQAQQIAGLERRRGQPIQIANRAAQQSCAADPHIAG
jgi:hypothetical protein